MVDIQFTVSIGITTQSKMKRIQHDFGAIRRQKEKSHLIRVPAMTSDAVTISVTGFKWASPNIVKDCA